jgi:hypothetical protein
MSTCNILQVPTLPRALQLHFRLISFSFDLLDTLHTIFVFTRVQQYQRR